MPPPPPAPRRNRTIVGLKQLIITDVPLDVEGRNRTIVGLKRAECEHDPRVSPVAIAPLWD